MTKILSHCGNKQVEVIVITSLVVSIIISSFFILYSPDQLGITMLYLGTLACCSTKTTKGRVVGGQSNKAIRLCMNRGMR